MRIHFFFSPSIEAPMHPSISKIEIIDPTFSLNNHLILDLPHASRISPMIEKIPLWQLFEISLPPTNNEQPAMEADGRVMIMRRKRMKKHWRKKYFKRDIVIYKKRERRRKLAAEKLFR